MLALLTYPQARRSSQTTAVRDQRIARGAGLSIRIQTHHPPHQADLTAESSYQSAVIHLRTERNLRETYGLIDTFEVAVIQLLYLNETTAKPWPCAVQLHATLAARTWCRQRRLCRRMRSCPTWMGASRLSPSSTRQAASHPYPSSPSNLQHTQSLSSECRASLDSSDNSCHVYAGSAELLQSLTAE